ncbi:MAG: cardiolipin synthase B, partial [Deltaproteobacteria bacterium]
MMQARRRGRIFVPLLFLILFVGLVRCAPLPGPEVGEKAGDRSTPEIIGPGGALSPEESRAVLDRLLREAKPRDILERHTLVMQSVGETPLILGNHVRLLIDGPTTYEAMLKAIRSAKDHVHLETFIFEDDEVGHHFADLLLKKRAQGVRVSILYDSVGCRTTSSAFFQ